MIESRRRFLRDAAIAGLATATSGVLVACGTKSTNSSDKHGSETATLTPSPEAEKKVKMTIREVSQKLSPQRRGTPIELGLDPTTSERNNIFVGIDAISLSKKPLQYPATVEYDVTYADQAGPGIKKKVYIGGIMERLDNDAQTKPQRSLAVFLATPDIFNKILTDQNNPQSSIETILDHMDIVVADIDSVQSLNPDYPDIIKSPTKLLEVRDYTPIK